VADVTVSVALEGAAALREMLGRLDAKVAKQILRTAQREAAALVRDQAQKNSPVRTGKLRREIKVRVASRMRKGEVGFVVTSGSGKTDFSGEAYYGAFQEWGWRTGARKKTSKAVQNRIFRQLMREARAARAQGEGRGLAKRGTEFRQRQEQFFRQEAVRRASNLPQQKRRQVPARPFMRPAFDAKVGEAVDLIARRIREGVDAVTLR